METTDKKGPRSFSLTKGEYSDVVARAKHHGMDNPAEYLLALLAFDRTHRLRADWNIVRGKATLVLEDFGILAAEGPAAEGHPVQANPTAIAHAAHQAAAASLTGKGTKKTKGSSAPK